MQTYRQSEVNVPHFRLPLQLSKGGAGPMLVNEQDSGDDIVDCIKAIVAFPIGSRRDNGEFGIPDIPFRRFSDEAALEVRRCIEQWEERANIEIDDGEALTDWQIWQFLVRAGVADG